jgi:hypothetical protein
MKGPKQLNESRIVFLKNVSGKTGYSHAKG